MGDFAGGQGNVEFKESIGLQLIVKFDKWLEGLKEADKAMNEFGKATIETTKGLTSTFVKTQTSLEKSASKITGLFKAIRNDLAKTTALWGTASLAMAQHATTMQRSMFALEKTAMSTGKSFAAQMKLIEDSIGGVASRAELLSSSVSLMSTSLDPTQMKHFVDSVKDTSAALGTDFSANVEHAVAALKTMDTRLLANMGIMVSMEELTKKMTLKFPGADPETLSIQQKQAAFLDVIIEKTKIFAGANKEMSEKGLFAWAEFKENLKDISIAIGTMFIPAWNSVAKVLASVTKSIKNFFENETVQKFGSTIAKVVVPAMVLMLAVFTAIVPLVALFMKAITVAPMIMLTLAIVKATKTLVGTGSLSAAFETFKGSLKNIGDPFSLMINSVKALKQIFPAIRTEMDRMQATGEATGKMFTDYVTAMKNIMPKIKETLAETGTTQEAKNITGIPAVKELYGYIKEKITSMVGPMKNAQQQAVAFGNAMRGLFTNIQAGVVGAVANIRLLGASLYSAFGKAMIGALTAFKFSFAVLVTTIRVGAIAISALMKEFLAIALPILVLGYGIQKLVQLFGYLKDKYVEHRDGSKELKDEVTALTKEYEGLAVAMNKAAPKEMKVQSYKDIVDYAEREGMSGKDLKDDWLKATGVKEAQSAGGRENIRNLVDQKNAIRGLKDGVSEVSVEFKKFSANVTELSEKAKGAYSKVSLYMSGLKTEEQAYMGMLAKASTLNGADLEKFIATEIEPRREKEITEAVNKYKKKMVGVTTPEEIQQIKDDTNKKLDAYINTIRDPKRTAELLRANRDRQNSLREFMRSDNFANDMIKELNLTAGQITTQEAKTNDERNAILKGQMQEQLEAMKTNYDERYKFLKGKLNEEYEMYSANRERLVALYEADQLNKTFFQAANGMRVFNIQVSNIDGTALKTIKKDMADLARPSSIGEGFGAGKIDAAQVAKNLDAARQSARGFTLALGDIGTISNEIALDLNKQFEYIDKSHTATAEMLSEVGDLSGVVKEIAKNWEASSIATAEVLSDSGDIVGATKAVAGAMANSADMTAEVLSDSGDIVETFKSLGDAAGVIGRSIEKVFDTAINGIEYVSSATDGSTTKMGALASGAEKVSGAVSSIKTGKIKDILVDSKEAAEWMGKFGEGVKEVDVQIGQTSTTAGTMAAAFQKVGDTIEEIDNKLRQVSLNKIQFELATLEVMTNRAIRSSKKLQETWTQMEPDKAAQEREEELSKQLKMLDMWIAKYTSFGNQLVDNQKNILTKYRDNTNVMDDYTRRLEASAGAIELANRSIISLKHGIAQQADPIKEAQKSILELQAQQSQAIGDVVGFHEKRLKVLGLEYEIQEKAAEAEKERANDAKLAIEERIDAARKEQEIRKTMFQVGSELERMDPRKNLRPQAQLERAQELAPILKELLKEQNAAAIAAAELTKKVEEFKRETLIEEAKLNKMKFDYDMQALAEERVTSKIGQKMAENQLSAVRELVLGLAKASDNPDLVKSLELQFKDEDKALEETKTIANAEKDSILKALNITEKSMADQIKAISSQTLVVEELRKLQDKGNGILEEIKNGLIRAAEAKDKTAQLSVAGARSKADERMAEERRISGAISPEGATSKPTRYLQGEYTKDGVTRYLLSDGTTLNEKEYEQFKIDTAKAVVEAKAQAVKKVTVVRVEQAPDGGKVYVLEGGRQLNEEQYAQFKADKEKAASGQVTKQPKVVTIEQVDTTGTVYVVNGKTLNEKEYKQFKLDTEEAMKYMQIKPPVVKRVDNVSVTKKYYVLSDGRRLDEEQYAKFQADTDKAAKDAQAAQAAQVPDVKSAEMVTLKVPVADIGYMVNGKVVNKETYDKAKEAGVKDVVDLSNVELLKLDLEAGGSIYMVDGRRVTKEVYEKIIAAQSAKSAQVSSKVITAETQAKAAATAKPADIGTGGIVAGLQSAVGKGIGAFIAAKLNSFKTEYSPKKPDSSSDATMIKIFKDAGASVAGVTEAINNTRAAVVDDTQEGKKGSQLLAEAIKKGQISGTGWGKAQPMTDEDRAAAINKGIRDKEAADMEIEKNRKHQENLRYLAVADMRTPQMKDAYRGIRQGDYDNDKAQRTADDRADREAKILAQNEKLKTQSNMAAATWDKMVVQNNEQLVVPGMRREMQPGNMDSNAAVAASNSQLISALSRIDANTAAANEYLRNVEGNTKQQLAKDTVVNVNTPADNALGVSKVNTKKSELIEQYYGDTGNTWAGALDWHG